MIQHLTITPSEELPRWVDRGITVLAIIVIIGYWVFVWPVKKMLIFIY